MPNTEKALGFFKTISEVYKQFILVGEQVKHLETRVREGQEQLAKVVEQGRTEAKDFHERLSKVEALVNATYKDAALQALKARPDLALQLLTGTPTSAVAAVLQRNGSSSDGTTERQDGSGQSG